MIPNSIRNPSQIRIPAPNRKVVREKIHEDISIPEKVRIPNPIRNPSPTRKPGDTRKVKNGRYEKGKFPDQNRKTSQSRKPDSIRNPGASRKIKIGKYQVLETCQFVEDISFLSCSTSQDFPKDIKKPSLRHQGFPDAPRFSFPKGRHKEARIGKGISLSLRTKASLSRQEGQPLLYIYQCRAIQEESWSFWRII